MAQSPNTLKTESRHDKPWASGVGGIISDGKFWLLFLISHMYLLSFKPG